jgi:hypothetical protein
VLTFGLVLMAFGVFFWWLAFRLRGRERELLRWGLANGGVHVALGATVIVASLMPDATLYVAGVVVVLLVAKLAARRRLTTSGG